MLSLNTRIFECFISSLPIVFLIAAVCAETLQVRVVNPLEKIFKDDVWKKNTQEVVRLECASNEYESAQFVVRSAERLDDVTVLVSDLGNAESGTRISASRLRWYFVGYAPVARNTTEAECGKHKDIAKGELLRTAPFDCPDPLLEGRSFTVEAGRSQPVWLTVHVVKGTPAGRYLGDVVVKTSESDQRLPIELIVYPFELPDKRHLYVTNWFHLDQIARAHRVEVLSERFWEILGNYAENLA